VTQPRSGRPPLIVVSGPLPSLSAGRPVVLWDSFEDDHGRHLSLPRELERHFERCQALFVRWRDGLGRIPVRNQCLVEALALEPSDPGSLWWATALPTTPGEQLPAVADILKLLLLEERYAEGVWGDIEYHGSNRPLREVLRSWCTALGVSFTWVRARPRSEAVRLWDKARWYQRLPMFIQAVLRLRAFLRMRRRTGRAPAWKGVAPPDMVIATYFPNVDADAAARGELRSHYWGRLHDLLETRQLRVRWLWVFGAGGGMTLDEAVTAQQAMNARAVSTGHEHLFVESALGAAGLLRGLALYGRFVLASLRFGALKRHFRLPGSLVDFFPLLAADWYSSLRGPGAMVTALYAVAYQAAVRAVPDRTKGLLYVWENQGWEHLLLGAWRMAKRGPAVGVVHVPGCAASMTLRNRLGPVRVADARNLLPDRLAVPGAATGRAMRNLGWPGERLVEVEALRFEALAAAHDRERRPLPDAGRRLLILTGIQPADARIDLELLHRAEQGGGLDRYDQVTIKPHPFCPVDAILNSIPFVCRPEVSQERIEDLCAVHDVVYCASGTTASLHAAWLGMPLIISGHSEGLNLSPFTGDSGAHFACTAAELAGQLANPPRVAMPSDYFTFDVRLPRWTDLLASALGPRADARA